MEPETKLLDIRVTKSLWTDVRAAAGSAELSVTVWVTVAPKKALEPVDAEPVSRNKLLDRSHKSAPPDPRMREVTALPTKLLGKP